MGFKDQASEVSVNYTIWRYSLSADKAFVLMNQPPRKFGMLNACLLVARVGETQKRNPIMRPVLL
jgi:hypothetical protein